MAVIDGSRVIVEVLDRMVTMGGASKILMSQRQYDALYTWWRREGRLTERDEREAHHVFGVPVVICSDCDLYVVPPTDKDCYGHGTFRAQVDGPPIMQRGIVVSDDGWVEF